MSTDTSPLDTQAAGVPVGHEGTRVNVTERDAWAVPGGLALIGGLIVLLADIGWFIWAVSGGDNLSGAQIASLIGAIVLFVVWCLVMSAFSVISPGETRVVQFFGRYVGTVRRTGLVMTAPLTTKKKVLVRVRNFETSELKVNDSDGNPVNIAAIIVWQVADTARASFAVEDYDQFVRVQSEAALRHVAMSHPYDAPDATDAEVSVQSLRGSTDAVSGELATEVAARIAVAGVEIIEVRISHLAYAPEIAQAMLQRQQAGAVIAAREKIVEGAVSMVEQALARLEENGVVALDDERRATMVSNLLVVLCGESRATPVINTGTLYG
jgi:hypothetical protein